jgi:hypothetical protein
MAAMSAGNFDGRLTHTDGLCLAIKIILGAVSRRRQPGDAP